MSPPRPDVATLLRRSAALRQQIASGVEDEFERWDVRLQAWTPWIDAGRQAGRALKRPAVQAGLALVAGAWIVRALRRPGTSAAAGPAPAAARASSVVTWALLGWRLWQALRPTTRRR